MEVIWDFDKWSRISGEASLLRETDERLSLLHFTGERSIFCRIC